MIIRPKVSLDNHSSTLDAHPEAWEALQKHVKSLFKKAAEREPTRQPCPEPFTLDWFIQRRLASCNIDPAKKLRDLLKPLQDRLVQAVGVAEELTG